ncbi:patatin-like phospholipase family protein [Myxococcus sp. K15C18031901]|uniref:patatin-like phospholipase family protein n=1 Tax=Myxococcus dinghuensis TaxID=2906761 RepID=UPI0020A7390F|nr:patatin-like phospholipase family protein [Myxococcus dinghuensis]MCP3100767.1 patatin-like phospholipase family protein [Myxococcus dinghuensis]
MSMEPLDLSDSPPPRRLGLALSGGGSRAAAFHRGILRGLIELQLVPRVDVVSTVSGGSLFGGAWMAARANGTADVDFLSEFGAQLQKGFVLRALASLRGLKMLLPWYNRSDLMADLFDALVFQRREAGKKQRSTRLADLPDHPALCVNTTLVNNGQVAKFSKDGFSAPRVRPREDPPRPYDARNNLPIALPDFRLSRAVAASAAFPVGLPPMTLSRKKDLKNALFFEELENHDRLTLTDGGVLENLGVQTLLMSHRFGTWDLIVSDAGTKEEAWKKGFLNVLKDLAVPLVSGGVLTQLLLIMNSKQNRWMRSATVQEFETSWLKDELGQRLSAGSHPAAGEGIQRYLQPEPRRTRRRLWFIRVNQCLEDFVTGLPLWRLVELRSARPEGGTGGSIPRGYEERMVFLRTHGVDLGAARRVYDDMGGRTRVQELNEVATGWTGLSARDIEGLEQHAHWQVLASHAIFGVEEKAVSGDVSSRTG